MKTRLEKTGWFLVSLAVPFFLLMTAIRLLITPLYPEIEYRMPYFPEDSYGFSFDERMKWAKISIDYLVNNEGLEFLGDLRLADGQPLYIERELSHMLDVKILVKSMITAWIVLGAVIAAAGIASWRGGKLAAFRTALGRGGKWTIGLIVVILAGVAISFNWLFTAFHKLFFTGDSWLFLYSDSLIRLFPMVFWRDAFIWVGALTVLGAVILIWVGKGAREKV
ncbi:MAG: TIGR01906 family membrane protein [Anaerolineaceae bacterium]|nr:TIGR01906 family membrane protein [Anaerolineaceae bacterium]